jgi:tankyrase
MASEGAGARKVDPRGKRRAQPLNQALPVTWRWVAQLPADIRPLSLLQDFPRIANHLARAWQEPASFSNYLHSLLIDRRGGRRGFPGEVQSELLVLRDYVEGRYPASPTVLDEPVEADDGVEDLQTSELPQ